MSSDQKASLRTHCQPDKFPYGEGLPRFRCWFYNWNIIFKGGSLLLALPAMFLSKTLVDRL